MLALLLVVHAALAQDASPSARRAETYHVVVAGLSGDRAVESHVTFAIQPAGPQRRAFQAKRTVGSWEEAGQVLTFDSDAPTGADPWFLRLQHDIASVAVVVELEGGAPAAVVDVGGWERSVRQRAYATDVPVRALKSAEQLIDADGMVRELRRDFPGTPPDGPWTREERVAGVVVRRVERCSVRSGRKTIWTCEGTVEGPSDGPTLLVDVETQTVIEADRRGLVQLESRWVGTLVTLGPDGKPGARRPIGERRLVRRR